MKISPFVLEKINKPVLICVQPTIKYFAWQVEVMLTNFKQLDLHQHFDIHILFAYNDTLPTCENDISWGKSVEDKFAAVAQFFYYNDTREKIVYISSVRPHLLKKHFKEFPGLSKKTIFYHDCDIVFTKFPDFILEKAQDDNKWYVSDTESYIGYNYIVSKGEDVLEKMCEIVGIHPELVKAKQKQSGGAQYILKGVDWIFFDKMERDCEVLFSQINKLSSEKKALNPSYHELQIWCADMWAMLWNGWLRGYDTEVIPEMDFCWATDPIEKYDEKYIFHNAGVTDNIKNEIFYKGDFRNKIPYTVPDTYDQKKAGYKYFEIMRSISDMSLMVKEVYENLVSTFNEDALRTVTDDMRERSKVRLSFCVSCNLFENVNGKYRCNKCGCSTRAKVFLGTKEDCPESKWSQ